VLIWDADILCGPKTQDGNDTCVPCEIKVSSVLPIPFQASEEIAHSVENGVRFVWAFSTGIGVDGLLSAAKGKSGG
jgi:hypothetical protein